MSTSRKSLYGVIVGAIIAVGIIVAGVYAVSGSFFGLGSSGNGTLQVSMIDPPSLPAGVTITHVYVNYTSIQVHINSARNQSGWYTVTPCNPVCSIDLMSIVANSKLLGSATLPSGTYNLVKFNVTSAIVTVSTSSSNQNYTANVPSGMVQAALTGLSVKPGATTGLLIDLSPKVTGDTTSGFTLVPSANARPTASTSTA